MKNKFSLSLLVAGLAGMFALVNGCQKDYVAPATPASRSFVEEFDTVANMYRRGWVFNNNSRPQGAATWQQGIYQAVSGKTGITFDGFPAYSYQGSPDEYIFAGYLSTSADLAGTISSWMISPELEMRNGDKVSFYTRTIAQTQFKDRLEVRLNSTDNTADVGFDSTSRGKFTTLLGAVNPNFTATGYPATWTKYEYTISGLPNTLLKRRIAFRYYVSNAGSGTTANGNAIGIDKFEFMAQ
jgi:hypothetical protein